jgi:nicotinamide-nucleotide amidase
MENNKKGVDIISIGDELLIGQVVNTNATWMAEALNNKALVVNRIIAIADSWKAINDALHHSMSTSKVVLVTGGLGPTKDDLTKDAICDFFGSKLVLNQEVLDYVKDFFAKRGRELTESNSKQAMLPDNCEIVKNSQGTAPGMHFEKEGTHFVFMPGVPFEMKAIMMEWVIPYFSKLCKVTPTAQKTVLTSGMGESFLADKISQWENDLPENTSLAYLPSPGRVRLRITVKSEFQTEADSQLQKHIDDLKKVIPNLIFGYDDDLLEKSVGDLLKESGKTISTAESCTGGMIAEKLTSIAGSSDYFKGSVVAYANEIKSDILNIEPEIIEDNGAVSYEVACAMADGVRKLMKTDIAVATTGIAGPSGGTEDKPVGTVWIAVADENGISAKKYQFGNQRQRNINWAVQTALNSVRKTLI